MGAYTRTDSKKVQGATPSSKKSGTEDDSFDKTDGFKKGGMACKKGGKVMSKAARPARKSGGGVLSSAASGSPRGKASHY
jgi:hypothetical protein